MTNEIFKKLLDALFNIFESVKDLPFWEDYSFGLSVLNFLAIVATLYFLIKYTRATENMAKYQLIPAVDVNMIYDRSIKKTYFWFSNNSSLPGIAYLEFKKNKENRKMVYQPLLIPPKRNMKTATTFQFSPVDGDRMVIYILVKPALEKSSFEIKFEKSYKFTKKRWDETSWSYPDLPFFNLANSNHEN